MLGGLTSGKSNVGLLKSRRAMLETLVKHLDMVKVSAGVLAVVALSACSGLIDGGGDETTLTPEEVAARQAFTDKAKPVFDLYCNACHAGSDPSVAFLKGASAAEVRTTLLGWDPQVVNLEATSSSRVLTKGAHSGPAMTAQQTADVLAWINAERDAAGSTGTVDMGLETEQFSPLLCTGGVPGDATCPINYVDISTLVQGWAGARIKFVAQPLGQDLYVTNLALEGMADGVYLEHPLFVSWPTDTTQPPIPDGLDRFFSVKMNLMATTSESIGGGTAAFINFNPQNKLSIHFKVVDKYRADAGTGSGGTGTGATGCKALAQFKSNAQTPLNNSCASCHANAGNPNARSAMDLTGITASDDATLQGVCDQARTRINFQDTNSSGFYIAPNPSDATNHPFKFPAPTDFDNFKTAIDPWIQAEKTAQ